MFDLSPRVKQLVDSKSTKELYYIFNALQALDFKLNQVGKSHYLNHELIYFINDILYDRYCEFERDC